MVCRCLLFPFVSSDPSDPSVRHRRAAHTRPRRKKLQPQRLQAGTQSPAEYINLSQRIPKGIPKRIPKVSIYISIKFSCSDPGISGILPHITYIPHLYYHIPQLCEHLKYICDSVYSFHGFLMVHSHPAMLAALWLCHAMPLKLWRDLGELGRIGTDWALFRLAWKHLETGEELEGDAGVKR